MAKGDMTHQLGNVHLSLMEDGNVEVMAEFSSKIEGPRGQMHEAAAGGTTMTLKKQDIRALTVAELLTQLSDAYKQKNSIPGGEVVTTVFDGTTP